MATLAEHGRQALKFANTSRTRRLLSALTGGLLALLAMLVFVVPAHADIIGSDDRHQTPDATAKPYASVVEITLGTDDYGNNLGACTGWMYAPNMVATAAHCVYTNPANVAGGYIHVSGMKVWPAINGSTATAPYGSCGVTASRASAAYVSTYPSYVNSDGDPRVDYGVLKLNCSVGSSTGLLTYGQPTAGYNTRLVGYPSDKPWDTQWYGDGTVGTWDSYLLYYTNDTIKRESGAPVMEWTGTGWLVVAIHSRGNGDGVYNIGPRFTSAVTTDLANWKNI
jgi:glutamyl endopeptidase